MPSRLMPVASYGSPRHCLVHPSTELPGCCCPHFVPLPAFQLPLAQLITLERYLPYTIQGGINSVAFYQAKGAVRDSGVEGLTFQFAWQLYAGHHLVRLLPTCSPHLGVGWLRG